MSSNGTAFYGDEIWGLHGVFLDSYPGEVGVYAVIKLSDGDINDISEDVLSQLSELGWIKYDIN